MEEKKCTICKRVKPVSQFYKKGGSKTGYKSWCRECTCIEHKKKGYRSKTTRSSVANRLQIEASKIEAGEMPDNYYNHFLSHFGFHDPAMIWGAETGRPSVGGAVLPYGTRVVESQGLQ